MNNEVVLHGNQIQYKNIAVIGHSQLPTQIPTYREAIRYHVFRVPGATVDHFRYHETFREFWNYSYDITIIFIGGNDIANTHCAALKAKLKKLYDDVINKDKYVIPCTLEHRVYTVPYHGRFITTTESYNRVSRSINQNLVRHFRFRNIEYIHLQRHTFISERSGDGIHFGFRAQDRLIELIVKRVHRKLNLQIPYHQYPRNARE